VRSVPNLKKRTDKKDYCNCKEKGNKPGVLDPGTFMYNWTELTPRMVWPT